MFPNESHGLDVHTNLKKNSVKIGSDDFAVRSPVIQKTDLAEEYRPHRSKASAANASKPGRRFLYRSIKH